MGVTQVLGKGLWGADTPGGGALYTFDATACCSKQVIQIIRPNQVIFGRMCATGHRSIWPTNYSFTYTETQLTPLLASSHFGSLLFYCSTDGSTVLLFY